ncbi:uncharacterized protein PFL1_04042 [Pseudozyma flocculosa PF-1]|uniref:Golgi apparatus membrane protein TVP38 n=2 Tax=Pseudozyma flocculosa TaxID=84751 RepID=A0A5C3EW57_9BASI|nr:uncharacterized protein PFL1_04042 [Pseudozyma flocculosa PF-1]EPQ28215.1 hypothetical protein PFL1_04042 [Pseudozyma flocculosa PF-1]SPO35351.1 uncharacterized protein PSFLO_00822 [Pseudozyma flocculosa]
MALPLSGALGSVAHGARGWLTGLAARYRALTPRRRLYLHLLIVFEALVFAAFIYIGPDTIFNKTASIALWISNRPYGLPLVLSLVVLLSFPPLFGYGTAITLCGLGWGVAAPESPTHPAMHGSLLRGWAVATAGCLLGASVSFVVLRCLIRRNAHVAFIERVLDDPKFRAMKEAVRRRGTSMAILIRFCPFPFCYSNLFFASLDTVSFGQFMLATALITPKLLLHVFIGARMFELMDTDERAKLDGWHKVLNVVYIVIGTVIGALTGWLVWKETQKILDQMARSEAGTEGGRGRGRGRDFVVEFDLDGPHDDDDDDEREYVVDSETPPIQDGDDQRPLLASPSPSPSPSGHPRGRGGSPLADVKGDGGADGDGDGDGVQGQKRTMQPFKLIDDDTDDDDDDDDGGGGASPRRSPGRNRR